MGYTVVPGTFETFRSAWRELLSRSATNTLFMTPCWQRIWWKHFDGGQDPLLLGIYQGSRMVGFAPLMMEGAQVALIGSLEVCDYRDLVLLEEHCSGVLTALLSYMESLPWSTFVLHSLPGASPTLAALRRLAAEDRGRISIQQEGVCPRVDLPGDWEGYLARLSKKDRHELRRKFRRLMAAGEVRIYASERAEALEKDLDHLFRLMRDGREAKAAFLTPGKEGFFRDVVTALADQGTAKLFFLEVDGVRAAAVLCFDYSGERLLYNSGFDLTYAALSVGLLLKAYALQDAIAAGVRRFDFLRGDEPYKYDLGGVDYPIYQCTIRR